MQIGPCLVVVAALAPPARADWRSLAGEPKNERAAAVFLREVMARTQVSAISAAAVQDGCIVFQRVLGVADRRSGNPADGKTVFRASSLSKPVFARLVMKFVEEGRLDLDKPLHTYLAKPLPEYEDYAELAGDDRWRKLPARTVRSHTTGFPNGRRVNVSRKLDFKAAPGERFGYSGEGYKLPVELDAGLGSLIRRTRSVANSAGSLLTHAPDYARFLLAMMEARGRKRETIQTMLKPQVAITSQSLFAPPGADGGRNAEIGLAWALGWGRFRSAEGEAYFHLGLEEGCQDYAVVFPERRTGLAVLSVQSDLMSLTGDALKELIGARSSPLARLGY
jgi:CubicO group peptidase (beta-lactamase class C family)